MGAELDVTGKALAAVCESVRPGEAGDAVGGLVPSFVAVPASTAEASALLRAAADLDLAVVPRGSGSRLGWGTPPSRCDLVVSTLAMGSVIEHAAGDLVARVQAGARIGDVAAVLATAGQEIALDVPATATIGGVVADALAGPRRLRYGSPRDLLIGITIVRADGTVAHAGGKVVKNVAGYDLGKLLCGSAGTLALITEVTFRLHPLPAARAWVTARYPASAVLPYAVTGAVSMAANSPLTVSAVEMSRPEPGGPCTVGVLLEGSAEGVAARAGHMADLLTNVGAAGVVVRDGAEIPVAASAAAFAPAEITPAAPGWWREIPDPDGGTLLRVSCWVSVLGAVLDAIDAAARETRLSPAVSGSAGAGVLYVTLPGNGPAEAVARFAGVVRASIPAGRGAAVALSAPEAVRAALADAGGLAGGIPGLALMRAVKDQFDPDHRLSPGRLFT